MLKTLKKLLDDGVSEVRDKAIVLFGKILSNYGESFVGNLLLDLNAQKMKKIQSLIVSKMEEESNNDFEIAAPKSCNNLPSAKLPQRNNNNKSKTVVLPNKNVSPTNPGVN